MRMKTTEVPAIKQVPSEQANFWRAHPLRAGTVSFWVHQYLEPLFGKVALADRRVDTVRGLLEYAVAFANHTELQSLPRRIQVHGDENDPKALAILAQLSEDRVEAWRTRVNQILRAAIEGSDTADLQSILSMTEGQIEWRVSLDRNIGWHSFGVIRGPDAFCAVVMSLLLLPQNRVHLRRCAHSTCDKLFLVECNGGPPRRRHCSNECMEAVNKQGNAGRARDRYKRLRAADLFLGKFGRVAKPGRIEQAIKQAFRDDPDLPADQLAVRAKAILHAERRRK